MISKILPLNLVRLGQLLNTTNLQLDVVTPVLLKLTLQTYITEMFDSSTVTALPHL